MDGPIQNVFPYILKWMPPYRMIIHTYYMVGPIQNVSTKHMQNVWPHTECFSTHTKWIAPYRMFLKTC